MEMFVHIIKHSTCDKISQGEKCWDFVIDWDLFNPVVLAI